MRSTPPSSANWSIVSIRPTEPRRRDDGGQPPDAIVCANDRTAARLMHTLLAPGVRGAG